MVKHLPNVECSLTRVVTDDFRTILSHEGLDVQRRSKDSSDDDVYLCAVQVDKGEEDNVEIDDDDYWSSEKSDTDNDGASNSFDSLTDDQN